MKPSQHYRAAEHLLVAAEEASGRKLMALLALAQVHATLATCPQPVEVQVEVHPTLADFHVGPVSS